VLLSLLAAVALFAVVAVVTFLIFWFKPREDPRPPLAPEANIAPLWTGVPYDPESTEPDPDAPSRLVDEIPGIHFQECPVEFSRPLRDRLEELPEVPEEILGPMEPIEDALIDEKTAGS